MNKKKKTHQDLKYKHHSYTIKMNRANLCYLREYYKYAKKQNERCMS